MKKFRKPIYWLMIVAMLFTLVPATAFAGDTGAITVPKTKTGDEKTIGDLLVTESVQGNVYNHFDRTSDPLFVTVELPDGLEFVDETKVNVNIPPKVAGDENALAASDVVVEQRGDTFVTIKVTGANGNADGYAGFIVEFGKGNVDIKSSAAGDIKVNVKAEGTPFESGSFLVARAYDGGTLVTAGNPVTEGYGDVKAAQIKIEENATGVFEAGDEIKIILPKNVDWKDDTVIKTVGLTVKGLDNDGTLENPNNTTGTRIKGDTLYIEIETPSSNVSGFITVTPSITVDDDFKAGDLEVTVKGDNITATDVVIAKIADFDVKVEADGDVPTILAGRNDSEIVQINIVEAVKGSLLPNRTITLELPSYAKFIVGSIDEVNDAGMTYEVKYHDPETADFDSGKKVSGKATLTFKPTSTNQGNYSDDAAELEIEDIQVAVDADAPAGDLVIEIAGTMGIKDELTVAKIVAPITVAVDAVKEVKIGEQNQAIGDIVITEAEDGAIMDESDNNTLYIKAPKGVDFASLPEVEVTEGNLEIDDVKLEGNDSVIKITIDSSSSKSASTIVLSDVELNIDRTVPVGDIKFEVYGSALNEVSAEKDIDEVVVAKFVAAKCVTPADGLNAVFNIGSALYTVNGKTFAMDTAPYIKNDRTYVPVRYLAYALGVDASDIMYDGGVVTLAKGDTVVTLTIGSTSIDVNGEVSAMDVAPEIDQAGRTMLPARFVAEAFGASVGYAGGTVVINK